MHGRDLLVIEKEDGSFIGCNVGMMLMEIALSKYATDEVLEEEAKRLYDMFEKDDKDREFKMTEEEVKSFKEADCKLIIPKEKNSIVKVSDFFNGIKVCTFNNLAKKETKENARS